MPLVRQSSSELLDQGYALLRQIFADYVTSDKFGKELLWWKRTGETPVGGSAIGEALGDLDPQSEGWTSWVENPSLYEPRGALRVTFELPATVVQQKNLEVTAGSTSCYTYYDTPASEKDLLAYADTPGGALRYFRVTNKLVHAELYCELTLESVH